MHEIENKMRYCLQGFSEEKKYKTVLLSLKMLRKGGGRAVERRKSSLFSRFGWGKINSFKIFEVCMGLSSSDRFPFT